MTVRTIEQIVCDMCNKPVTDDKSARVRVMTKYIPDPSGNNDTIKEYAMKDICHQCIANMFRWTNKGIKSNAK